MQALQRYKISSLPVLASASPTPHNTRPTALFHGFVDVPVLLDAFLKGEINAVLPAMDLPPLQTECADSRIRPRRPLRQLLAPRHGPRARALPATTHVYG